VRSPKAIAALGAALLLTAFAVACADTSEVSGPDSLRLDEWSIELGSPEQAAGTITLQVQNVGTMEHEVILIRTTLEPDKLPQQSGTVNLSGLDVVGRKDGIERREKTTLEASLTPGSYVFICNLSGHYALGMRAGLVVK